MLVKKTETLERMERNERGKVEDSMNRDGKSKKWMKKVIEEGKAVNLNNVIEFVKI